jgi:hypothetical protein
MKKLVMAATLVGGALMASQSAFGQFVANDLYMGFQNQPSGSSDYIINLGAASGIVGQTSVVDLSSDFSLSDFDSVLGSSSSMFGGVVGGQQGSTADVYLTQLRSGGAGTPSVAGSIVSATMSRAADDSAVSTLGQLNLTGLGAGQGTLDASKSWEAYVEPANTASTFFGNTGLNPDSSVSPSTVLYEDLWFTTKSTLSGSAAYTYEGYFTLDLTGSSPDLTFTGANVSAVPEPTVFSLLGGAGLLLLSFRRQLSGKIA